MFTKRFGVSLNTYVNTLRIERAKVFLLETNESVLTIALNVGLQDAAEPLIKSVYGC